MPWYIAIYLVVAFTTAALNLLLAFFAWRNREAPGANNFIALLGLIILWSVVAALQTLSPSWPVYNIWQGIKLICLAFSPVVLLTFAIQFLGWGRWLKTRRYLLLFLIPLITQCLFWRNPAAIWHSTAAYDMGVWFNVHTVYSFVLIFIAMLLMGLSAARTGGQHRRQLLFILLGISIPVFLNIFITFEIIPSYVDLTPVGFTLTAGIFAWTLYRHRLFEISPLARDVVIERLQDAMLVLDTRYQIVDYNPAAQRALKRPGAALQGAAVAQVLPAWDALQARLETDPGAVALEGEFNAAEAGDATARYFDVHITPLHDRQETRVGYVLLLHDITERKQAEAAIHRYAQDLEARNAELDAFAHTVAHDLKTPLTALIGFSALLHKRADRWSPEQVSENAERIHQTGQRMQGIVEELLLLASVRKAQEVNLGPLDMQSIVAAALERLETQIADSQAVIQLPEAWPAANGYAPWVLEIWVNYLSNALKYGGQPPQVELGYSLLEADRLSGNVASIKFWIHDNGPGLTETAQKQLFVEFTRLEQARAEGHGLGLSIVFRIARKLGGEVGVESSAGQGSTFWFTLPIQ